jgi:hypothetical protein
MTISLVNQKGENMNRKIIILTGVIFILLFFIGSTVAQTSEEIEVQTAQPGYWPEVLNNKNKILIALPPETVERLGTNGIKEKFGHYHKAKGTYYVAVNKNDHKKMLSERWGKSIKEAGRDKRWQALIKTSNHEKGKISKYLERQSGSVSSGGDSTGSSKGLKNNE